MFALRFGCRILLLSIMATAGCMARQPSSFPFAATAHRARAPRITLEGVPNLHQVSAALYRSGQPTAEGFRLARQLGIRTVVNLRAFHSDHDLLNPLDMQYASIPVHVWHPKDEDVIRFLRIVANPARQPVLVHCWQGADRTGVFCAVYRIAVEGWTREEAIEEMTGEAYGFHETWAHLAEYIRGLDVDAIRRQAGLAGP